jgi:hypothetical protein
MFMVLAAISAIFRNNALGVASVNSCVAVGSIPNLTAACGNTSGHYATRIFNCSYRFMWGALIRNAVGDAATGATVRYSTDASSFALAAGTSYTYKFDGSNTAFKAELTSTLAKRLLWAGVQREHRGAAKLRSRAVQGAGWLARTKFSDVQFVRLNAWSVGTDYFRRLQPRPEHLSYPIGDGG